VAVETFRDVQSLMLYSSGVHDISRRGRFLARGNSHLAGLGIEAEIMFQIIVIPQMGHKGDRLAAGAERPFDGKNYRPIHAGDSHQQAALFQRKTEFVARIAVKREVWDELSG
jgi:hypothetical protein